MSAAWAIRCRIAIVVVVVVLAGGVVAALCAASGTKKAPTMQAQAAAAAAKAGVPERLLLAVGYLQSRWETNGWQASTSGGYGPMHLTDPAVDQAVRGPGPTLDVAARISGLDQVRLRSDLAANLAGGAAVLADDQRSAGLPTGIGTDVAGWYGAVARYSGIADAATAGVFADNVYDILASGATRVVDDGSQVRLDAVAVKPDTGQLRKLGLADPPRAAEVECPESLACEWVAGAYTRTGPTISDYGSHDIGDRPAAQRIEHIVIHATEETYTRTVAAAQDPNWGASWHYTIRSSDGHIVQHIAHRDVAWHAGNWSLNSDSIGIEHEGRCSDGRWFTESMYRSSAKLVGYLAKRYGVPLDRAHIVGHDNVPASNAGSGPKMHTDPGPYWDWQHYFELLGAPIGGAATASSVAPGGAGGAAAASGSGAPPGPASPELPASSELPGSTGTPGSASTETILINPSYPTNRPVFTGCSGEPSNPCPEHGSSNVVLRTRPSADAALVEDKQRHPEGSPATLVRDDDIARVSTGQRFAVAARSGDWIAIWYLGQQAWLRNPADAPVAVQVTATVATPKQGKDQIAVYGLPYPDQSAVPAGSSVATPLAYQLAAGQRYTVDGVVGSAYFQSRTFDGSRRGDRTVVHGSRRYVQIQFGLRFAYVDADDVDLLG